MTHPEGRPGCIQSLIHPVGLSPSSATHGCAPGRAACPVWGLHFFTVHGMKVPTGWGLGGCCKDGADMRANWNELAKVPPAPRPVAVHALRVITGWDSEDSGQRSAAGGRPALWLAGGRGHRALAVCVSVPHAQGRPSHSEDPQPCSGALLPPGTVKGLHAATRPPSPCSAGPRSCSAEAPAKTSSGPCHLPHHS